MNRNINLKPTEDNLLETYRNDTIGRNKNINKFINVLNSINGDCTIALSGSWGSGKTFFVKQVINIINSFDDSENEYNRLFNKDNRNNNLSNMNQMAIYYDAWEHDDENVDPMISLIYSLTLDLKERLDSNFDDKAKHILEEVISYVKGIDINGILKNINDSDIFNEVKTHQEIETEIKNYLNSIIAEKANRLVIFVDELDRCCPLYAVKLLERIKHFFCNDKITFVFSINMQELACIIKKHYGNDFDATGYFNRFFDFIIDIPELDLNSYLTYIGENTNTSYYITKYKYDLIKKYKLSMRDIGKFVRMSNICSLNYLNSSNFSNYMDETNVIVDLFIIPLLIVLKMKDCNKYFDFINGNDSTPLLEVMNNDAYKNKLNLLLSYNEVFDKNDIRNNEILVTREAKINDLYNTLFKNWDYDDYVKNIGSIRINKDSLKSIMSIASMLSDITRMNN